MARPPLEEIFADKRPPLESIFAEPEPAPKEDFIQKAGRTLKDIATTTGKEIAGFAEGAANTLSNFTTGAAGQAVSGLSALNTFVGLNPSEPALNLEAASRVAKESMERLQPITTYTPQTEAGQKHAGIFARPFEDWSKGSQYVGNTLVESGHPTLGAILGTGLEVAPIAAPIIGGKVKAGIEARRVKTTAPVEPVPETAIPKVEPETVRPPLEEIFTEPKPEPSPGISVRDKVMNRIDSILPETSPSGHPQTKEYLAGEMAKEGHTISVEDLESMARGLREKGAPSTDMERSFVRILADDTRSNRHLSQPEVTDKPQYRVVMEETPLEETPDHWTTNSLEDANAIKASMQESDGLPRKIVEVDPQAVAEKGGKPQGKSPYGTGADWIKTDAEVTPDAIKGVVEPDSTRGPAIMSDEGGYNISEPPKSTGFDNMEVKPLEMPEIVELVREMSEGKLPQVMQNIRKRNALGVFRTGNGDINLKADIFKTPGLAERVLAHEIGHLADWLPDKTMARGNILGRIASLKKYLKATLEEYEGAPGALTPKDRVRIRKAAEEELKAGARPEQEIIEEITREIPKYKYIGITPEMIKQIWTDLNSRENFPKLYEAIARMSDAEKASVMREAMKGLVSEQLQKFGERVQVGVETVTEKVKRTIPGIEATPEQIAKRYRELIEEEIGKRNLYKRDQIMQELKDLTLHWKPFTPGANQFTKYRFSGEELYADALSVLLNDPATLRRIAPTFEKAFFSYMERKPTAQDVYYDIQQRLRNPQAVQDTRLDNIYEMFRKGHEARQEAVHRAAIPPEGIKDTLSRWLVDREHAKLKTIRKGEQMGGDIARRARQARQDIEEVPYIAAEADNYLKTAEDVTTNILHKNGLSIDDLGAYMMARHIIENRADIANVGGHSAQTATVLLDTLHRRLGDRKYAVIEKAANDYRHVREKLILPRVEASGILPPSLLKVMRDRTAYAKVSVQKFLEEAYGAGVTSKIYKQIGTLQDIENPFVATVLQDMSLLRAAKLNESKRSTVAHLTDFGAAQPVEMRYSLDIQGKVPVEPKDPRTAVLTYMERGTPQHVYVSKVIADTFNHSPFEATKIGEIWATIQQPIRDILVSKNPVWMARNVARDFRQTIKNNPEVKLRNTITLAGYYKAAFGEVWRDVVKGERSADIARMKEERMLIPNRVYEAREMNFENEIQRLAAEFNHVEAIEAPTAWTRMKKVYNYLDKMGRVSEVSGKLAGYKYLKDKTNLSDADIAHRVRTRIGTPDYKRQGELQQLTNNVFMFSNVNKEGIRSAYEAFKQDKAAYIWKSIATNIVPKLVILGAAATVPEWKDFFDKVPNYDKRMYTIIPLGYDRNGKAVYARIPEDYEGQFFGALVWDIAHGKVVGKDSATEMIAAQSPYRLHPLIQTGTDLFQYYVKGMNPMDEFRGKNIIPDTVFKAGGMEASKSMGKHVWKSLGGGITYEPQFNEFTPPRTIPEKILKTFPLNTIGTFIKISDQGLTEKMVESTGEIRQEQARRTLEVRERIADSIERGDSYQGVMALYRGMKQDGLVKESFQAFRKRYEEYKGHTSTDPMTRAMSYAKSKEEKKALRQR